MLGTIVVEETAQAKMTKMALELYETHRQIQPAKGRVLVWVLPKEQKWNSIHLPDAVQNKPLYEGLVLAIWTPYTEERGTQDEQGRRVTKLVERRSALEPGDHVLFEHYAGIPFEIDQKAKANYRILREEHTLDEGGIIAKVVYDEAITEPHRIVNEIVAGILQAGTDLHDLQIGTVAGLIAAQLNDSFLLLDRSRTSVTLSGR